MRIAVRLAFDEQAAVRLLNWLARENAVILQQMPELPLLYDSGVIYRREADETWCDYLHLMLQGHEDCDGLAAARAGELLARGYRALRPGEDGYAVAQKLKPQSIFAEVFLRTRSRPGESGLYHCLVHYNVGGHWFRDDPSAKLGMYGRVPREIRQRWAASLSDRTWRTG